MKPYKTFQVYCIDADGSERKSGQYEAKSKAHAMSLARQYGVRKVSDAVELVTRNQISDN